MSRDYSKRFRLQMVRRMIGPNATSAHALSKEVGVSQSTLSKWLRESSIIGDMTRKKIKKRKSADEAPKILSKSWTAKEKVRLVAKADELSESDLGAFLRREGLHEAELDDWRSTLYGGFNKSPETKRQAVADRKRIRELERELNRKEKALAEAAALLVLSKKYRALQVDEGDDMFTKNGKR